MFVLTISRSSLKLGHLGSKTRSPGQIKGRPCYHSRGHIFDAIIMNLAQMFALMISRSSLKLGHMGSKLGHQAKSKENLVNTPEVTFFKYSS